MRELGVELEVGVLAKQLLRACELLRREARGGLAARLVRAVRRGAGGLTAGALSWPGSLRAPKAWRPVLATCLVSWLLVAQRQPWPWPLLRQP